MQTRIYVVSATDKPSRLVEAGSAAQAIRHCVAKEYTATVATAKDVARMLASGTTAEVAETKPESNANTGNETQE